MLMYGPSIGFLKERQDLRFFISSFGTAFSSSPKEKPETRIIFLYSRGLEGQESVRWSNEKEIKDGRRIGFVMIGSF